MKIRGLAATAALLVALPLLTSCTGGTESNAAQEEAPKKNGVATAEQAASAVNVEETLGTISKAIPIYAGARYRDDLTRRDQVMVRNQYGPGAEVYTLASDDSFPQVFHYYTTFMAQFRAFPSQDPYPPENKDWRTLEVQLNQSMQDPFIPGETINAGGKQVILQVAETEAEPKTVIRYIVTPGPVATAGGAPAAAAPVAR